MAYESKSMTPQDIMHRIKTRLTHTCATVDQPIRDLDNDLDHVTDEIDDIQDCIEDIQEDMCELYCKPEHWAELNTLMSHIRAHLDEAHYLLMDRANMGGSAGYKIHNEIMGNMRRKIRNSFMTHHKAYADNYGLHDLTLD